MSKIFRSDLLASEGHFLKLTQLPEMPIGTYLAKQLSHNGKIYLFGGVCKEYDSQKIVQVYNVSSKTWSQLPPLTHYYSGAAILEDKLTLIGGEVCPEKSTSKLMTWTGVSWQELYPAMHTARSKPGVLLVEDYILVSGGIADGRAVDTIEVMNVNTRQWIKANLKLPRPLAQHIMALCGEYIYIYHWNSFICRMEKKNCIASLTGKEESSWQQIEKAPPAASLLQHSVQPVIAGIKGILTYEKKKWISIGEHLSVYYTTMASLNENSFITFGGERKGLQDYLKTVVQYSIAVELCVARAVNYDREHSQAVQDHTTSKGLSSGYPNTSDPKRCDSSGQREHDTSDLRGCENDIKDNWSQTLQTKHWVYMLKALSVNNIVDHLLQGVDGKALITLKVYDEIGNAKSREEANKIFLMHLLTTGTIETFELFCKVLHKTSNDYAIHEDILERLKEDFNFLKAIH